MGAPVAGLRIDDLDARQCRFPLSGTGFDTLFCAAAIPADDWRPGFQHGCYCRAHRDFLARLPRVATEDLLTTPERTDL